jgi:hypothetical protein
VLHIGLATSEICLGMILDSCNPIVDNFVVHNTFVISVGTWSLKKHECSYNTQCIFPWHLLLLFLNNLQQGKPLLWYNII